MKRRLGWMLALVVVLGEERVEGQDECVDALLEVLLEGLTAREQSLVDEVFEKSVIPTLSEYIKIPNKSPAFDPDVFDTTTLRLRAPAGERSAIAASFTPGVRGTCARYMAANLPAPMTPMRSGRSLRCCSLA